MNNIVPNVLSGAGLQTTHSVLILSILGLCSVVCLAFIVERWLYFRRLSVNPEEVLLKIKDKLMDGKINEALALLGEVGNNPVLSVIQTGIKNSEMPAQQVG